MSGRKPNLECHQHGSVGPFKKSFKGPPEVKVRMQNLQVSASFPFPQTEFDIERFVEFDELSAEKKSLAVFNVPV